MATYAWPKIGRAGLGNSLLPWARAELFAARMGARVLEPGWTSFRPGPYFRREADKRNYGEYFLSADHVRGTEKLVVQLIARRIDEGDWQQDEPRGGRPLLVRFSGLGDLFASLIGHQTFIRDRLWGMTLEALRPTGFGDDTRFIAMHVRRGDITRQGFSPSELAGVMQYTPLSWYIQMARAVRACPLTSAMPVVVFTDGYPDEVADLLRLPGVQLRPRQTAITDLWALTQARLLFASGYSTFSMWASYLGGMPTLYAPGKLAQRVLGGRNDAFEMELAAGGEIPAGILNAVDARRPDPH